MADQIHGMAINGMAMEAPDLSLNTDWKDIETRPANVFPFSGRYRVVNGILFVTGYTNYTVQGTGDFVEDYGIKIDPRWKLPDQNTEVLQFDCVVAGSVVGSGVVYILGSTNANGYAVRTIYNMDSGANPGNNVGKSFSFAFPII